MCAKGRNALLVGGSGRVARLTTPLLQAAGFAVTSVIRDKDRVPDIEELGAAPLIQDVTRANRKTWEALLDGMDVVVWTAGVGGPEGTGCCPAVDRDAVITLIDALDGIAYPARFLTVGYAGPVTAPAASFSAAKRAVGKRLQLSSLEDAAVLGPTTLSDDPARGIMLLDVENPSLPRNCSPTTSRELLARVIAELAGRPQTLGRTRLHFSDGDGQIAAL